MQQGKSRLQAAIDGTKGAGAVHMGNPGKHRCIRAARAGDRRSGAVILPTWQPITAAAVLSMFASLTLVPMLAGLSVTQRRRCCRRTCAIATGWNGRWRGLGWLTAAKQARKLFCCAGWSLVLVGWRRLALLSIPIVLLVASIFCCPQRTIYQRATAI